MLQGRRRLLLFGGDRVAAYSSKVLGLGPSAYWPLWETAGSAAVEQVGGLNGTYSGVTLGQPGIGDGRLCPYGDGVNDFVSLYTAGLSSLFNWSEGSLVLWHKLTSWTGPSDYFFNVASQNAKDVVCLYKYTTIKRWVWSFKCNSVAQTWDVYVNDHVDLTWYHLGITWSVAANEVKLYKNGAQYSTTKTHPAAPSGDGLNSGQVMVLARYNGASHCDGWAAHLALWAGTVLTADQMASLAVV